MVQHSIIHSPNFKYWESYRVSGQWYFTDRGIFIRIFSKEYFICKNTFGKMCDWYYGNCYWHCSYNCCYRNRSYRKGISKKPQENATLIVLGCKVYGEHASRSLRERLDAALIYLEENPNSQCIVSGGMGEEKKSVKRSVCTDT